MIQAMLHHHYYRLLFLLGFRLVLRMLVFILLGVAILAKAGFHLSFL
jgi:hypothetical protein